MVDKFPSAPIPGEGLANPPGQFPWERPPQFSKPDEAVKFIWKRLLKPNQLPKMLHLLENGATVADIAKGTLTAGFLEGLWTIDLMMLIDKNVFLMIATLAEKAGIKYKMIPNGGPGDVDSFIRNLNSGLSTLKADGEQPQDIDQAFEMAKSGGAQEPVGRIGGGILGNPTGQPSTNIETPPMGLDKTVPLNPSVGA